MATAEGYLRRLTRRLTEDPEQLDVEELSEVELKGVVEQFRGVADFVVRGQRCNASQAAFGNGKPAQLKVGAKVKLHGRKQGDLLIVTELEFDD